ncbi:MULTISPECIES: extracellular matrix/biofilm biosynthesis regulator RemA family protein [Pseudobutyrivibrio]|jgi:hypothetical protein|uniref:Putative regulatory protein CSX00_01065 n=1 Tax=Pseudobutyrivibrio ruminis TaxID=46206 RepID=A0A2G3EDY8_9FIRM|nr:MULTISPECIES: extracellular matrix/biofilm biosynthesis regulator RemA family protein [Pseudobutyrivibrio]MBE5902668.1 DUF370 domain-containing protein [Pseudobutyrivibrio sp.]PHU34999.1 hypothetical protein CSX01_06595 [Pseudobutyrivibrio ruminis]PHU41484.1 hypothetical protein CSX00_01065 [Pseudobutyrivibrio ruminis]
MAFVNIGFGNIINSKKIVSMLTSDSAPAKRIVAGAKEKGNIIDATQGRRTRAVIVCDSHVVLSALMPETISARISDNFIKEDLDYDT